MCCIFFYPGEFSTIFSFLHYVHIVVITACVWSQPVHVQLDTKKQNTYKTKYIFLYIVTIVMKQNKIMIHQSNKIVLNLYIC